MSRFAKCRKVAREKAQIEQQLLYDLSMESFIVPVSIGTFNEPVETHNVPVELSNVSFELSTLPDETSSMHAKLSNVPIELPDLAPIMANNRHVTNAFVEKLIKWQADCNVSKNTLTYLLKILQSVVPGLPLCAETLLKSSKNNPKQNETLDKGNFVYLGFKQQLCEFLTKRLYEQIHIESVRYKSFLKEAADVNKNLISVQICIDGIPLFKNSKKSLWPILMYVNECPTTYPIVCGAFYGSSKPDCMKTFLHHFVNEINEVISNGITCSGTSYLFKIFAFTCDAPARAMIKCVKSFASIDGCDFCKAAGSYSRDYRKVIYAEKITHMREDSEFLSQGHHNLPKFSVLNNIYGIQMISMFVPDSMHSVYLGVTKRFIKYWIKSLFRPSQLNSVSEFIVNHGKELPCEFKRRMRNLEDIDYWKAKELRCFLLYVFPLLKNFFPSDIFKHFMLLSFSIYVLSLQNPQPYVEVAEYCLNQFVLKCSSVYNEGLLVYNVHILLHLTTFVKSHGPLDTWSCFRFENYLYQLKRRVRSPKNVLSQVQNQSTVQSRMLRHVNLFSCGSEVKDSVFLTHSGNIIFGINYSHPLIHGNVATFVEDLYKHPYPSATLKVGIYKKSSTENTDTVVSKCICFSFNGAYAVLPFVFSHPL